MANDEVEKAEKDGAEILGAVLGALAVVALLPAVVVALVVIVTLRILERQWWWATLPAVLAVAVVALVPGLASALHSYVHAYGSVIGSLSHHHRHVAIGGILIAVLPLAVALGLPLGVVGAGLAQRKWALDGTRHARSGQPHDGRGMRSDAPTARRREVKDLIVPASESRRLVLGRAHRRWLAAQADDHVVVIAPTGSGKTTSLVIPSVLRLSGPLVVTSSKGDIIEDREHGTGTLAHRSGMGACHIFDPSGSTPYPCVPWSPLGRAATWQGALRVARTMLAASGRGQSESGTSSFFASRAEQSLAPLLHAAALAEGDMSDVLRWVRQRDWSEAEGVLTGDALESLGNLTSGSKESLGDTLATMLTVLRAFEDPQVARNTSEPIWSPSELVESRADTLFVVFGPDAERLSPIFTALIDEVISAARERTLRLGRPLDPPLWLLLDEAGTGLAIPELPSTLARSRGEGIRFLTVWQDLGQLKRLYSDEGRSGILGNSAAQVWWPPDDGDTARYLSDALGHQQVRQISRSKSKRGAESESESESISTIAVLDAGEARTLAGPLLLYRGKPPLQIEAVPYYRDSQLSKRSRASLPTIELPPIDEPVSLTQ